MSNVRSLREVSLTALWNPLVGLMAADVGDLLYDLRYDYPVVTEEPAMPLWTNSESFSATLASNEIPSYCWWMTTESDSSLVRFQFDRITYSWRHSLSGNAYPGYAAARGSFANLIGVVGHWVSGKCIRIADLGKVRHVQVDYVNRIDMTPLNLVKDILTGGQASSPEMALPVSLGKVTLERGEAIMNIESDGLAGSALTVTSAIPIEGNVDYLTHLDQAQRSCQEAFSAITPARLLSEWGKLDAGGIRHS